MAATGSLLFCTDCGNLLDPYPDRNAYITCDLCGKQNQDTRSKVIVTSSKPSAFPSSLRTKLRSDVQDVSETEIQTDAAIRMTCDKCGCEEVRYTTQQLRSADEGTTVFYTCPQCGNKWNTNN